MTRLAPILLAIVCACATSKPRPTPSDRATLVLRGGRLFSGDPTRPRATAIAAAGDRILLVGSDAEVNARIGPATRVIELGGRDVLPGFIDAHAHFARGGREMLGVNLAGATTLAQIQARVREYARAHPSAAGGDGWILGRGWSYELFAPRLPTRKELDAAERARPVALTSYDGHTLWLNTRALALVGLTAKTPDPEGGRIAREAGSKRPAGCLLERALDLAEAKLPKPSAIERRTALADVLSMARGLGVTALEDLVDDLEDVPIYQAFEREGALTARISIGPPLGGDLGRYQALREELTGPLLRFGVLKGIVDGVIEASTAAMLAPYAQGPRTTGDPMVSAQELGDQVAKADARGFQIALHAIGDRAVRMAIDAYEAAIRGGSKRERRHRVEHVEVIHPDDIVRFGSLEIIASMQPFHASPGDEPQGGVWSRKVGPKRLHHAFAWRELRAVGARLAFGSDWPVAEMNPLLGLYTAITRKRPDGTPPEGWGAHQAISVEEALAAYGRDAAYAIGRDDIGVLKAGLLADLVVLAPGVRPDEPSSLPSGHVDLTISGGRVVYERRGR